MTIKTIKCERNQKLSKLILDELGIAYNQIQKIIRNKDVKINSKRVSKDVDLVQGDIIEIYINEKPLDIVYEDDNIVIVLKPKNIETVSEFANDDLKSKLSNQLKTEIYAVHRLDRNTQGLVIFAKNNEAKKSLDEVIKDRKLEKFYLAKVIGIPAKNSENLIAYLKKDEKKSLVSISDKKETGYEEIKTNYKVLEQVDDCSILEVELITGKTHQIRAHLSHIGYPILGDEKYGNAEINRMHKKKYQCLCSYKFIFHFEENNYLFYLNNKIVELDKDKIDFLKNNK
ncbi:MAG: RluA family pseudouridine synthase [Clostridia bacterium]|nr:RluA family pseudouridine synthase [Clostridia bacterium]